MTRAALPSTGCCGGPGFAGFVVVHSVCGIAPVNWLSQSSSLVTRPRLSVVTPCHSPSGLSLSQLVLSTQSSPSVASYSATKAAQSGEPTNPPPSPMPAGSEGSDGSFSHDAIR